MPRLAMPRLASLQVLRAIAALAVALLHFQNDALKIPGAEAMGFTLTFDKPLGAGVDLFFVISGFVMLYASNALFECRGAARLFLARRIARIVPLYWLLTTILLVIYLRAPNLLSSGDILGSEMVKSYLFIPYAALGTGLTQPVYKLGWTLNYEMTFYLVFAAFLGLPRRKAVLAAGGALIALVLAGRLAAPQQALLVFWTNPIMLEFVFGLLIGLTYLEGYRLSRRRSHLLGGLGLGAIVFSPAWGVVLDGPLRPLVWGLPCALVLAATVLFAPKPAPAGAPGRCAAFLTLLGDASYAIYLLHPLVIRAFRLLWEKSGLGGVFSPWLYVFCGLAMLIPLSILTYRHFERPLTQTAQRWLTRRPPADAVSASS